MSKFIQEKLPIDGESKEQAAKTVTYAVMHLVVAMAVAYALSGSWKVALGIGLIEPAVQTVAYTVHERFWRRRAERKARGEGQGAPLSRAPFGPTRPAAG